MTGTAAGATAATAPSTAPAEQNPPVDSGSPSLTGHITGAPITFAESTGFPGSRSFRHDRQWWRNYDTSDAPSGKFVWFVHL
jgi:hypothetical protein